MARHPEILWAQRSDKVYVTVELLDAKTPEVKLEPEGRFTFHATVGAHNQKFETDLELFGAINVEKSTVNKGQRHTVLVLEKAEKIWWPRLVKAEGKAPQFVKVDWNKWVDEDEEDEAPAMGMGNFDMGGMGAGLGGGMDFSGMGGDDEEDMDDEDDMPELESTETAVESEPTKTHVELKAEGGARESAAEETAKI